MKNKSPITALSARAMPVLSHVDISRILLKVGLFVLGLSTAYQLTIAVSYEDVCAVALVVAPTVLTLFYVFTGQRFFKAPLSSMLILGNNFITQLGALVFQSVSLETVTKALQSPVFTFKLLAILQVTLIAAHWAYLSVGFMRQFSVGIGIRIWGPLGLMKMPSGFQFSVMALVGCASVFFTRGVVGYKGETSTFLKFIEGFNFMVYLPLVYVLGVFMAGKKFQFLQGVLIIGYFGVILVLGIMSNSRAFIAIYPVTIGLLYILGLLSGAFAVSKTFFINSLLCVAVGFVLVLPLSNFALAFEIVRGQRTEVGYAELIKSTFRTAFDSQALRDYIDRREAPTAESEIYSEAYLSNPFLNRLVVVKYQDNMLSYVRNFSDAQIEELRVITVDKLLALLPNPVLVRLKPSVNKNFVSAFSMGDYIAYLSGLDRLGGFRLGSVVAHGYGIFSYLFFPIAMFLSIGLFVLLDSFGYLIKGGRVVYCVVILSSIWTLSTLLGLDSAISVLSYFIRFLPQSLILYWLLLKVTELGSPRKDIGGIAS